MYPCETKLACADHPMLAIDGDRVRPGHEDDFTLAVELESDGGSGDVQVVLKSGDRTVEFILKADDAMTLSETLAFYANASRRIAARNPALFDQS